MNEIVCVSEKLYKKKKKIHLKIEIWLNKIAIVVTAGRKKNY